MYSMSSLRALSVRFVTYVFFFFVCLFCCFFFLLFIFFFFQAEDGIRDLVRSRGLGDVYKRQQFAFPLNRWLTASFEFLFSIVVAFLIFAFLKTEWTIHLIILPLAIIPWAIFGMGLGTVSYTHLTLPTSDLV